MNREQHNSNEASEDRGWSSLVPQKELGYHEVDSRASELAEDYESSIASRNRRIGEKVLRSSNKSEKAYYQKISVENLPSEREDYKKQNQELLEMMKAPEVMKKTYDTLLQEIPGLRCVELKNYFENNACYRNSLVNGIYHESIDFNFKHSEIYTSKDFEQLQSQISSELGISEQEIKSHPDIYKTFIFLHEFGHAVDFHRNFLNPELDKVPKGQHTKQKYTEALSNARNRCIDARTANMAESLLAPRENLQYGNQKELQYLFFSRIKNQDIRSVSECELRQQDGYRKAHDETYADNFAVNFIKQHPEIFSSKHNPDGLHVELNKMQEVGPEQAIYNNMFAGCAVKITPLGAEDSSRTAVIKKTLRPGEKVELSYSGDPTDHSPGAESVSSVVLDKLYSRNVMKKDGTYNTERFFTLKGVDFFYRVEPDPSGPPKIDVEPEEFFKRYKIKRFDKMAFILRDAKNNFEDDEFPRVRNGSVFYGELINKDVRIGDLSGLELRTIDGSGLTGARIPYIKRFYRQWKTYYAEGYNGAVTELLPLPKDKKE